MAHLLTGSPGTTDLLSVGLLIEPTFNNRRWPPTVLNRRPDRGSRIFDHDRGGPVKKEAVVPGPSSYELTFGSQCPEDPCPPFFRSSPPVAGASIRSK